ncbi:GNAT family N-acetyltransferase [Streptomyces sp. URMC 123]|uniref:GNAT family N-acetyltransferase n=1 Tax=Streptomyces sp. URMC 123 TaxID=3423403 RepID=UPI003F19FFD7
MRGRTAPPPVVTVRRADEGDLDFLVRTMETAARSHLSRGCWEVLLDEPPDRVRGVLRALARSPRPHWCHLSRFWVAEVAGERAGALTAFDPATEGNAALVEQYAELAAAGGDRASAGRRSDTRSELTAAERVGERRRVFQSCVPADYPDSWGIENVAVAPRHRGTGVTDALFAHALELGRRRGHEHAQILCLDGNARAQRAWERNGFEVRAEYRGRRFASLFGCPGLKLLVREY